MSMEQFRERLVDYLYGELEGQALHEFEVCLAESAECRRELAALQGTLRTARAGLSPVDREAPPARVRTAVIAAAAEVKRVHEPSRAVGSSPVHEERAGGWLSWLRTAWLVPTVGVAAAVALVVLGREIEPVRKRHHEAEQDSVAPKEPSAVNTAASAPASAPASVPESSALEAPPRDESVSLARESEKKSSASSGRSSAAAARTRAPAKGFAVPPAQWASKPAEPPAREPEAPVARRVDDDDALGRGASWANRAAPADALGGAASAAPPVPAAASRRADSKESADEAHSAVPPRAPARRAAAPVRVASKSADRAAAAEGADPVPAGTIDELVRRAQEHLAAQRFRDAASDYRALLRLYPTDVRVPAWQKLLAFVTGAARPDGGAR